MILGISAHVLISCAHQIETKARISNVKVIVHAAEEEQDVTNKPLRRKEDSAYSCPGGIPALKNLTTLISG